MIAHLSIPLSVSLLPGEQVQARNAFKENDLCFDALFQSYLTNIDETVLLSFTSLRHTGCAEAGNCVNFSSALACSPIVARTAKGQQQQQGQQQ